MPTVVLDPADVRDRLQRWHGHPAGSVEVAHEFLRAEVHARGHAPRAVTLSRVARLLAPAVAVDPEVLDACCTDLEREGDLTLSQGGILHATPTRLVPLPRVVRVFGSTPTRVLARLLEREVKAVGTARTLAPGDDLTAVAQRVGCLEVTPERWAGLERTPVADEGFLAKLDQRLAWHPQRAGALERDGALDWRSWQAYGDSADWRRATDGRLWRARAAFGGQHHAWTASGPPSTSSFIVLDGDTADRARFALARTMPQASVLQVRRHPTHVDVVAPFWLPRPEYRWLSLHAQRSGDPKALCWQTDADGASLIERTLGERLGLTAKTS